MCLKCQFLLHEGITFGSGYRVSEFYCLYDDKKTILSELNECPFCMSGVAKELMKLYQLGMTDFGFQTFP
jgi:hypothetical protein